MEMQDVISLILKVIVSSLGAVGLIEWLKNFIKTEKKIIWAILMPIVAAATYIACELLPIAVIGSILTTGSVQLNYQILVQGFKKVFNDKLKKITES